MFDIYILQNAKSKTKSYIYLLSSLPLPAEILKNQNNLSSLFEYCLNSNVYILFTFAFRQYL